MTRTDLIECGLGNPARPDHISHENGVVTPLTLWLDHLLHEACALETDGRIEAANGLLTAAIEAEETGETVLSGRALLYYRSR